MASGVYNQFKTEIMKGTVNVTSDTIKEILLNNSHSFNADHDAYSDISANELATAGGYTQNTKTVGSPTATVDDTDDEGVFDAADTAWTSASFTAYHNVKYDDTHASNILVCSIDFGGAQTVTSGTFTIQYAAEGIININ
jgi:hypothetical protein